MLDRQESDKESIRVVLGELCEQHALQQRQLLVRHLPEVFGSPKDTSSWLSMASSELLEMESQVLRRLARWAGPGTE
jgi:hypothetical protein